MSISNISVDNDAQMFEITRKNSSITAPGAHILLGFDDAWLFETPRINIYIVTVPITLIFLSDDSAQSFEPPPKNNHGVTAQSSHILL